MTPCRPACFGKLPIHGDFIWHNVGQELRRLDEFIQQGLLSSREALRDGWRAGYTQAAPAAFLRLFPQERRLLCGVLRPSCDSAGRDYPFLIACVLDGAAVWRRPALAPLVCAGFLERARGLLGVDWSGRQVRDVQAEVDGLAAQFDEALAERELDRLLQETSWEAFVQAALGSWEPDRAALLLYNALSLMGPRSKPRFALAFPSAPAPQAAALWLHLIGAVRGKPELCPPLTVWGAGDVRCVLAEPAGDHYGPLFLPQAPNDACILHEEGLTSGSLLAKARERVAGLVPRASVSLADLATTLARAGSH